MAFEITMHIFFMGEKIIKESVQEFPLDFFFWGIVIYGIYHVVVFYNENVRKKRRSRELVSPANLSGAFENEQKLDKSKALKMLNEAKYVPEIWRKTMRKTILRNPMDNEAKKKLEDDLTDIEKKQLKALEEYLAEESDLNE